MDGKDRSTWIFFEPLRAHDRSAAAHQILVYKARDRIQEAAPDVTPDVSDAIRDHVPSKTYNTYPQGGAADQRVPERFTDQTPSTSPFAYLGVCRVDVVGDSDYVAAECPHDPAMCVGSILFQLRSADTFYRNYGIGIDVLSVRLLDAANDPLVDVPLTIEGLQTKEKTAQAMIRTFM